MKTVVSAALAVAAFAFCHSSDVKAASFDCSKATTASEVTICNNPKLSDLDTVLSAAFNQIIRQNPRSEHSIRMFAQEQLDRRNACGSDVSCIIRVQVASIITYKKFGATVSFPSWAE